MASSVKQQTNQYESFQETGQPRRSNHTDPNLAPVSYTHPLRLNPMTTTWRYFITSQGIRKKKKKEKKPSDNASNPPLLPEVEIPNRAKCFRCKEKTKSFTVCENFHYSNNLHSQFLHTVCINCCSRNGSQ